MSEREIIIADSVQQLYIFAADHFQRAVLQAVKTRGQALVVLSGGNTPSGFFASLIQPPFRDQIPWNSIHFFWADERCIPSDHPESNFGQAKKQVFDFLPIHHHQIHPVNGDLPPLEAAALYQTEIAKFTEAHSAIPRFDWVLLGMGSDGHTASLFPGQPLAANSQELIRAVQANYEDRPAERITMTEELLNQAHNILFLLIGSSKAGTLRKVLLGDPDPLNLPAQRIQPIDGHLTWLVDQAAAAEL